MPSEYSPGGSKPRMSRAQIRKLQADQEEARRIAEEKIAAAKNSDEWKKEQAILAELEDKLEVPKTEDIVEEETEEETNVTEKPMTFWEELVLFLKTLFK